MGARRAVVADGLRAKPPGRSSSRLRGLALILLLCFVPLFFWFLFAGVEDGLVLRLGALTGLISIATTVVLIKPDLLTDKGAELRDYLLGMKQYLTLAEEDRMRVLQSPDGALQRTARFGSSGETLSIFALNEKLLPYAVLWGVEREWAKELELQYAIQGQQPQWYAGDFPEFGRSISSFVSTSAAAASRPVSSSSSSSSGSSWSGSGGSSFSSGSSGGGFSGGGGGGGGGGGR